MCLNKEFIENDEKIERNDFNEILGKIEGFKGEQKDLNEFSEKFTDNENSNYINLKGLMNFLNNSTRKKLINRR